MRWAHEKERKRRRRAGLESEGRTRRTRSWRKSLLHAHRNAVVRFVALIRRVVAGERKSWREAGKLVHARWDD